MKSYLAASVPDFLTQPTEEIVGRLAIRVGSEHSGNESQQIRAWRVQIDLLKEALRNAESDRWGILLELPLLRLGRRIDTIILINDVVVCVEFKIGAANFTGADVDQAVDYALCLRDFHAASHGKRIIPVLCSDQARRTQPPESIDFIDDVSPCIRTNGEGLPQVLQAIAGLSGDDQINWQAYDAATYSPTPDIVTAARSLYSGHSVKEIGRADATAEALERTANRLKEIAEEARRDQKKVVCFVTGEPGSGKTLLGLDLVFSGTAGLVAEEPAALLSGNRPLVFVLQAAIAEDARQREGIKADEAKRRAQQALQTLLGYLKDHSDADAHPPENVIVFDEAQRAWDADTGLKLLGRAKSEPELFMEIMGRLPWACLVCLVGSGQEINRGEGGLALWGEALAKSEGWSAHISDRALAERAGLLGFFDIASGADISLVNDPDLHLNSNLRAYRNNLHGAWVAALLNGEIEQAREISRDMEHPPALITRNLSAMKAWLQARRRGDQRVGLLASSGATRLVAEGIPPSPRSDDLGTVTHWFLKPAGDFRSSNALETPLSEFVCQGLEIDYAGLCWGNDLTWNGAEWVPRKMRAPNWQLLKKDDARQYRINTYRVLLTRGRAGTVVYVPHGDENDRTRAPKEFDGIYDVLKRAGCQLLS
ncbi:DNA/RNA helicase domain-containing protein [Celeribacter halophilus]|uniref:DNA/RNA helicase domain-containing protein n=1 Tax=Celeribacter halophilus TaxID=576117 RepID=UPI003A8F153B